MSVLNTKNKIGSYSFRHCFRVICLLLTLAIFSGCSLQNQFSEKQPPVLSKNNIKNAPDEHEYKLSTLVQQKPNSRFIQTFRLSMWTYLALDKNGSKDTLTEPSWFLGKFWQNTKKKVREGVGEKPVFLDSGKVKKSADQMERYLLHKGYFHSEVEPEIMVDKHNATVNYQVKAKAPFLIKEVSYFIPDRKIYRLLTNNKEESLIQPGEPYTSDKLANERNRISKFLKNQGYYNFTRQNINFEVDTSAGKRRVQIGISISNPGEYERHTQYKVRDVYLEPDYNFTDTIPDDTIKIKGYHFIVNEDDITIRPRTLLKKIKIDTGKLYSEKAKQKTYNHLSQLAIFKFIDIRFQEVEGANGQADARKTLDCYIQLTTNSQMSINGEFELTTSDGNEQYASISNTSRYFGIAPSISFRNKNLFKRGIAWDLNLRGAYEFSDQWIQNSLDENIYEIGGNTSLNYYGSFIPRKLFKQNPSESVKTSIDYTYLVEGNPNYQRNTHSGSYTWEFGNPLNTVYLTPVSVNLVSTNILTNDFRERIESINNPFIENIFDRYSIIGSRLTVVYDDEPIKGDQHWLIRWAIEPSGNMLYLFQNNLVPAFKSNVLNQETSDKPDSETFKHTIGNIGYYTYAKTKADFRYYLSGSGENELIFRFAPGIGVAYANNSFMPFEKRFFVGGSNSIRAWAVRELGPGSFSGISGGQGDELDLRLLQVGDIKLEGNLEYRFKMFKWLNGALFFDYGNVWTLKKEAEKPGGKISEDFYKEIAMGTGYGFRFDFQIFVFRLDLGWPIRSPLKPEGERFVARDANFDWILNEGRVNIGIGYPF